MSKMNRSLFLFFIIFVCPNISFAAISTCSVDVSISDQSNSAKVNSIQWCINSLSSGGRVELGSGTYYTSGPIIIVSGITIRGSGANSTIIEYNGRDGNDEIISNNKLIVSDITVRDLTIRGSGYGTGYKQVCILIQDDEGADGKNKNILIRNTIIEECGQFGIHIKSAEGVYLKYNVLKNNGTDPLYDHNIYLRRVSNAKVELSTSNYAAGNGLNVSFSENVVVRNLTAKFNGQNGIRFASSSYVKAYKVVTSKNGYNGSDDDEPCNDVDDNLCNGIELRVEDYGVDYACVKDSIIKNNYTYGIYVNSATNYFFQGNTESGNESGNIEISSSSIEALESICEGIPEDSSVWPFSDSDDAEVIDDWEVDDDGDEYTEYEGDCNDTNFQVSPTADEICDGIDNDCDTRTDPSCDDDGDGLKNSQEWLLSTDPNDSDTDDDGFSDYKEVQMGTDPNKTTDILTPILTIIMDDEDEDDNDGDGLTNATELSFGTDPDIADTNGDGISDYQEYQTWLATLQNSTDSNSGGGGCSLKLDF